MIIVLSYLRKIFLKSKGYFAIFCKYLKRPVFGI